MDTSKIGSSFWQRINFRKENREITLISGRERGGQLLQKVEGHQGIIDPAGTQTWQFFSYMFVIAKIFKFLLLLKME